MTPITFLFPTASRAGRRSTGLVCRRVSAFSLVELLAVVSIIAVLAAILIAVTVNLRRSAQRSTSAGNLRQIGVGLSLHAADHGHYPDWVVHNTNALAGKRGSGSAAGDNRPPSKRALNPYLGVPAGVADDAEVPLCQSPADSGEGGYYETKGSSYGYANIKLDGGVESASGPLSGFYMMIGPGTSGRGLRPNEIQRPALQIASYEMGAYLLARFGDNQARCPDAAFWYSSRAEGRFNVVFADGHVEFLKIVPGELVSAAYSFRWTQ